MLLVKESSHLQPDRLVTFANKSFEERIELFSNEPPLTVDAKFEQKILQSTDCSNECFHCHGLVSENAKSIIMFIHGGPHRFGLQEFTNLDIYKSIAFYLNQIIEKPRK